MKVWGCVGVAVIAALLGCGEGESGSGSGGSNDGGTGGQGGATAMGGTGGTTAMGGTGGTGGSPMTIPSCGAAMDNWVDPDSQFNGGAGPDYGTPETAWQVGTATQSSPYVQGNIGASGNAFFVFCAGAALNEITIFLNDLDGTGFTQIHIHDGAGDVFGAEVTPTMSNAFGGTWPLTPGETYVFEVSNAPDAFF